MSKRTYAFKPDYAVHPGLIIEEHLEVRGWSQAEFARRCGRSPKLISEIIAGKARLEPKTALEFQRVLGLDAGILHRMESAYRLHETREAEAESAKKHREWLSQFPTKELIKRGILPPIQNTADGVSVILAFFGVGSVGAWNKRVAQAAVRYRHSPSISSDKAVLATWLHLGELEAVNQKCADYDKPTFRKAIRKIRDLTRMPLKSALGTAQELMNAAGVALAIVKPFPNMAASGAAWWHSPKKGIIQLSARRMSDDHLWFSLFHEAAHILHDSKKLTFIDARNSGNSEEERQANEWAANALINRTAWKRFIAVGEFNIPSVTAFAQKQGIAEGIVVGRLQHEKLVPYNRLNNLKRRLEWQE